ncbi:Calcineurin-like phosphoesterase [Oceanobacillus limi]|uniref:Calcineurin-like phosphoesterase n=1 Tax=Oceanobacillus limi TaxID=930131 RepID=A0A1I0F8Z2_9BACI|nr:metallophosphoesterase [Oceanobacillus limi]SET54558.1 Calcineurin-like phosphoesterase [Oceanobacillus limi]
MLNVKELDLDKNNRVIVISDIHGQLDLLKELLTQVKYAKEDYLFLNGDLCEKGPNSLEVVHYVQELVAQSDRVFVTKGNCDVLFRYVFDGVEGILQYMRNQKYSILNEMLTLKHKSLDDFSGIHELAEFYRTHFREEINWLESLPNAYQFAGHIIVHAGIDHIEDWRNTSEDFALFTKAFYEKEHRENKNVIVGHWPVVNYRAKQISSNNPIIDEKKRVIALDGGNQIKKDGQLNALLIENGNYDFSYVDELKTTATVQVDHEDSYGGIGTVTYPNYDLEILERHNYFTRCKNINLGIQQWVKNEYIETSNEYIRSKGDLSTTFLSVANGEKVFIIDDSCAGYTLIKKITGEVGWIPNHCLL